MTIQDNVFTAVNSAMQSLLSSSAPRVCAAVGDEGMDIFHPSRRNGRNITLHSEAAEAFPETVVRNLGSLSVRQQTDEGNIKRRACDTFQLINMTPGSWWSVCLIETKNADDARKGVDQLAKQGITCALMADLDFEDKAAQEALEAIQNLTYAQKGLQVEGVTPKVSSRYDFTKLAVLYTPSGGPSNPDTLWSNSRQYGSQQVNDAHEELID